MCLRYIRKQFKDKYERWGKRNGYHYNSFKAEDIYAEACGNVGLLPVCESTKVLITQAITQLQAIEETLATIKREMQKLASTLPEYDAVMALYDVGRNQKTGTDAEFDYVRVELFKPVSGSENTYAARKFRVSCEVSGVAGSGGETVKVTGNLNGVGNFTDGTFNTSTKTFTEKE